MRSVPVMLALILAATVAAAAASQPPNIVLIMADDLGWTDLSVYGSSYYQTPNIDTLASQGVRFTNAYACSNCAPTRAALMSGRYSPRTGIYTVESGDRGLDKFRKMVAADNKTELALSEVTIAELLKSRGYRTAHMGKWHLGGGEHLPTRQGFDVNVAGDEKGNPGRNGYFSPYQVTNISDGPEGEYLTDRLSTEAVSFIRDSKDDPFFLYMCYYTVHTPILGRPDLVEKWKQRKPTGTQNNAEYAAMINSLDDGVGRITAELDKLGLADNTVVIFYSDNGGVGGYRRAGVDSMEVTDNAPLRGGKGMLYEGGVRVPLIVRYPGVTKAGTTCDTPVINVDFLPTLGEIAGASLPTDRELDGRSFAALLRGEQVADRSLYWHFPGYLQGNEKVGAWRTTPAGAIRAGDFKLIEFFETGTIELYNLREDISEQHDLAKTNPAQAGKLHQQLRAWRAAVSAPMPRLKE
jgi:arylsulfatase A-like enzyme